ncbi:MAG: Riboflavin synthase [Methanonatronarchaeales archaeon]|nr:Riboflavin synthase [Methanonatronarchaeales archaeon]
MKRIGVADTTFARVDMAGAAVDEVESLGSFDVARYTVPGVKDLPVACIRLIEEESCDLVMALGMPGPEELDRTCAHEASQGIIRVQLKTGVHVLEVFVHEDEAPEDELRELALQRARDHALNAVKLLEGGNALTRSAGTGMREGHPDRGPLR